MHRSVLLLLLVLPAYAHAQGQVTIYRCTDASGHLTIQNGTPCPKGSKQKIEIVETPMVVPRYTSPPAIVTSVPALTPAPEPPKPAVEHPQAPPRAQIADADRLPPPPIYQCTTWDNLTYLSEDFEPKPRCVALQTTGLGGDPNNGAGAACEMKYDICARVPDETNCDGWKQRQREIESTWRYAPGADKHRWQDECARVTKILSDTICGK